MKPLKLDLEHSRLIFREIGLIIVLVSVLLAFEIKSYDTRENSLFHHKTDDTPEEFVEITQHEKPPPPPAVPKQTSLISIVENEMEIEEDVEIDVEADQDTEIEEYYAEVPVDEEEEEEIEDETIFVIVESMPMFPGGEAARLKYLSEHIKYPAMAQEAGIQGKVFVQFVVEKNGSITDVQILRGIGGGCDEEAKRLMSDMPNWIPGKQRNMPVRVRFNMPIRFVLL